MRARLLPVSALFFAGALAIGTSVPASALLATSTVGGVGYAATDGQSLEVSAAADLEEAARATFGAASGAERRAFERAASLGGSSFTPTTGSIRWPFPFSSAVTDGFGARVSPCAGCSTMHKGVDFTPGAGAPIYTIAAGVVESSIASGGGLGNHVIIDHVIGGKQVQSVYAHMQTPSTLKAGDKVEVGEFIGSVGSTGAATGPHLHFELHVAGVAVDPYAWLTEHATDD
jgi:murein DD-endopeptidase MepM/ murein hydrolase activator NlpD